MFQMKDFSKDTRKRLSQSRKGERKDTSSAKKNYHHNRSSSMHRDKKSLRFQTDYNEYDQVYTTNIHPLTKLHKRVEPNHRRDTFDCAMDDKISKGIAVQSTKNDPNKNLQIKSLFKPYKEQLKLKPNKNKPTNHPFLKFISKKNNKQKFESPFIKPIQQRHPSQNSQAHHSLSNNKNNQSSIPKKPKLIINKNQIIIKPQIASRERNIKTEKTQKIHIEKSIEANKGKGQEQWTVKTIKKHKEQLNESVCSNESFGLTEQEETTFGDRFPYGFQKSKLLGRGGFSLVWLGKHIKSGRQFAIKQIITQNTHQTHIKQIWFGTMFFTLGGVPKPQFNSYPGVKNLVRLYSYEINQTDTWIFYEKCGQSLGSCLYDIRSQKIYGEQKLYKIIYKPLYQAMALKPKLLTKLVIQICKALALLSQCEIVHSDLKTQNILLKYDRQGKDCEIRDIKLIDYGSSFQFKNISQFSMATPEYMPPQILNYIIHQNEGSYQEDLYQKVMNNYNNPWAVDMWSLGCVLLEIVVGVPLWMSLPLLVPAKNGGYLQKEGLFAVKGRLFPEIIIKQRKVNPYIGDIIEKDNYSRIVLSSAMKKVLIGMLDIDFNKRISPLQVIEILEKQLQQS